jgi:hypothetical protein
MLLSGNGDMVIKGLLTTIKKTFPLCRFILLIMLVYVFICEGMISDKRLCGDTTSDPVSLSKALIPYTSDDTRILSFVKETDCVIYSSKSAGSRPDLWGAEKKGIRGYIPKRFVTEGKILSSVEFVVNTEEAEDI